MFFFLSIVLATLVWFMVIQRKHFLVLLLVMESVVVMLIFSLPLVGLFSGLTSNLMVFILLVMGACEASVGLSVMVFLVRFCGSDLMKSITVSGL